MIVKKFTSEDIKDITCASDFYKVIGLLGCEFEQADVFGHKMYYANLFISPRTDENIREAMQMNVGKLAKRVGSKTRAKVAQAIDWGNFAPICNGPRYDQFEAVMGTLKENIIYILQPGDDMYEENPHG